MRCLAPVLVASLCACSTTTLHMRNGHSIDGAIVESDADHVYVRNRMESISTIERSTVVDVDYAGRGEIIAGAIITSLGVLELLAGYLTTSLTPVDHEAGEFISVATGTVGGGLTLIGLPILIYGITVNSKARSRMRPDGVSLHVSASGVGLRF